MISEVLKKMQFAFWLLPGFLLWASFPPMGEGIDCLFALAPLLWSARKSDFKTNLKRWIISGFIFYFSTLMWMPAIVKNGGPLFLVILGWGALAVYCTLYFAAFGSVLSLFWSWQRAQNIEKKTTYLLRVLGLLVVEPLLWAGLEIIRSRFGGGFAWNQLGVAMVNSSFGASAVLGGVYLVSALVILVNGTIASLAERMWKPDAMGVKPLARSIETFLPFLIIFAIFSFSDKVIKENETETKPLTVALVQRNFPSVFERDREENPVEVYSNLLSVVSHTKPDLVVLPESALMEFGRVDSIRVEAATRWMRSIARARAILAGGERVDKEGRMFNSAGLFTEEKFSSSKSVYDKVHLVPFGEFIPLDKTFPILQKFAPVGSCTPGELKTLKFDDINLGVAICFEDTDSAQMRMLAEKGAQLLVFITNDSWFSKSDEAEQHAWQASARAIETGLPIVRVGNSGVTGTISRNGKTSWLVDSSSRALVDKSGTMVDRVEVPITPKQTPYTLLGDKPLFIAFLALILIFLGVGIYKKFSVKKPILIGK